MTINSEIINLRPDFTDARGEITDIFVNNPKDHCSLISNTPNAIRANHYHKLSTQYTYVVEGSLALATVKVNKDDTFNKKEIQIIYLEKGALVTHKPYEAHAFKSLNQSIILAFACGVRGGKSYEEDVYRIKDSLFS